MRQPSTEQATRLIRFFVAIGETLDNLGSEAIHGPGWGPPSIALSIIGIMRFHSDDADDRLTVRQNGDGIEAREYANRFREIPHRPPPAFGSRR